MNEYFYGDRINSTYKAKETDPDTNSPVGNLNPFANNVTADAAHIDDVPSVETIPDLAPAIETIVPETPWNEKIPDLAPAVEETIVPETPWVEKIPDLAPAVETIVPETPWVEKIPDLAPAVETFYPRSPCRNGGWSIGSPA